MVRRSDRDSGKMEEEQAEMLFIGTGAQSNADLLDVHATGVKTDPAGFVEVNEYLETNVEGIWALGDITGRHLFRHTANYESQVVWYNMTSPNKVSTDEHAIPHAVYTYPTVGSVGLTEADAKINGLKYLVGVNRCWPWNPPPGGLPVLCVCATKPAATAHTRTVLSMYLC
jgi:dihydrolipoamide dehydrogenase